MVMVTNEEEQSAPDIESLPRIPSMKVLFILIPVFCFTLVLQGVDLREQANVKENSIRNVAMIEQINHVKNDFELQASGWDSLVDANKANVTKLQAAKSQLEAQIEPLTSQHAALVSDVALEKQQLETARKNLTDVRSQLQKSQAEFDLAVVGKTEVETATVRANTDLKAAETARDLMKQESDNQQIDLAAIKQQVESARTSLKDTRSQFQKTQAELDLAVVSKTGVDAATVAANASLKTAETARDFMEQESAQQQIKLAAQEETLKQQAAKIDAGREQVQALTVKMTRLATIDDELKTKESIASALIKEVQRLTLRKNELDAEIKELEEKAKSLKQPAADRGPEE
jgi:chromosome segregation ATPase